MSGKPWEETLRYKGATEGRTPDQPPDASATPPPAAEAMEAPRPEASASSAAAASRIEQFLAWRARKDGLGAKPLITDVPLKIKSSFKPDDPAVIRRKHDDRLSATYKAFLAAHAPPPAEANNNNTAVDTEAPSSITATFESPPVHARSKGKRTPKARHNLFAAPRKSAKGRAHLQRSTSKPSASDAFDDLPPTPPSRKKVAIKLNFDSPEDDSSDDNNQRSVTSDESPTALYNDTDTETAGPVPEPVLPPVLPPVVHTVDKPATPSLPATEAFSTETTTASLLKDAPRQPSSMSIREVLARILLSVLCLGLGVVSLQYQEQCGTMLRMRVEQLFHDASDVAQYAVELNTKASSVASSTRAQLDAWTSEWTSTSTALVEQQASARAEIVAVNEATATEIHAALGAAVEAFRATITASVEAHARDVATLPETPSLPEIVTAIAHEVDTSRATLQSAVKTYTDRARHSDALADDMAHWSNQVHALNVTLLAEKEVRTQAPPTPSEPLPSTAWDANDYYVLSVVLLSSLVVYGIWRHFLEPDARANDDTDNVMNGDDDNDDDGVVFIPKRSSVPTTSSCSSMERTPQVSRVPDVTPADMASPQRLRTLRANRSTTTQMTMAVPE
ncbi:hypothetical protein SPRG_02783 [Saprolegnia parasitica CBS 223.65]|uniref:Uncharacterized protein n=1 Tax=Saprolegnia parasitica (strain CBS 223.65) TaxID=695850 RepID=A0A067CNP4_SAPPC|nr:hypothetical protein SPRG_02783 [Saprolegnia parasitica CBS 223.65]KDO32304.1 hypothetical protein SPRG_02783 [Saprolegnia parasitica CBS 223.65]|eukprot:XP_012196760.1 hypothetical protein SPRG_02783 [Saprolegnia parasitica CBS 223.65]